MMKIENVNYGDDPLQKLDLYITKTNDISLLVYIHGGSWVARDKSEYFNIASHFVNKDISVAIINYRLSNSINKLKHPIHIEDCSKAINFLCLNENGIKYGYNSKKIFISGHSAGGHICGLLSLDSKNNYINEKNLNAIKGYIGIEGIYDIPHMLNNFPSYKDDFVFTAFGEDINNLYKNSSPINLVSTNVNNNNAPWLLIHSNNDELVKVSQSHLFFKHLFNNNINVEIVTDLNGKHFQVVVDIGNLKKDEISNYIYEFIRKNL